jgi:sucrose phosphorylase
MQIFVSQDKIDRFRRRLSVLYPEHVEESLERLLMVMGRYGVGTEPAVESERWNAEDTVLITYADMVQADEGTPLNALTEFATEHLNGAIKTVHLLPCYPWTSDDGFSVVDYRQIHPDYGDWKDVETLGDHFDLMFDLVLNHCSASSSWFKQFIAGHEPGRKYFLDIAAGADLSAVTRPRTSPVLTPVHTRLGGAHVWTTFSADQVDLNWQNPDVFFEFLDIFLLYISKGSRMIRLDAVAFLWKKIGTSCLHLRETHEVIQLFRDIFSLLAPHVLLLTETNVPHKENISYFGDGDEAHMVYNFSLPPLVLHALLRGDASELTKWAGSLPILPGNCTFFNFTASHDGIGMRPLQGILPDSELRFIVDEVQKRDGRVNFRKMPDGSEVPYELNITYYSALAEPGLPESTLSISRFMCSQLTALALKGMPAVYFHSLTATLNYLEGVEKTGANRTINRRKWERRELDDLLANRHSFQRHVFTRYTDALRRRAKLKCFHPNAAQQILDLGDRCFAVKRTSLNQKHVTFCLHNFSAEHLELNTAEVVLDAGQCIDLLTDEEIEFEDGRFELAPYQVRWLMATGS